MTRFSFFGNYDDKKSSVLARRLLSLFLFVLYFVWNIPTNVMFCFSFFFVLVTANDDVLEGEEQV